MMRQRASAIDVLDGRFHVLGQACEWISERTERRVALAIER